MKTAVISYRVADFLKQYPPFQAMEETDLLALSSAGRVKFHQANEHICWQGAAHGPFVYVIQQGTVSLWEESDKGEQLRDIRGAGDLLAIDRFNGSEKSSHSARSASDVVIYALPVGLFEPLLEKYPSAARYIEAHGNVATNYQPLEQKRGVEHVRLCDLLQDRETVACHRTDSLREAAQQMLAAGASEIAVTGDDGLLAGVLDLRGVLSQVAGKDGPDALDRAVESAIRSTPLTVAPDVSVSDCTLAMAARGVKFAAVTDGGTLDGRFLGLVSYASLTPAFGDQPAAILSDIAHAAGTDALQVLNRRVRAFALAQLHSPPSLDWLAHFTQLADTAILKRVIELTGFPDVPVCWCYYGAAGRQESLTRMMPAVALILSPQCIASTVSGAYRRVLEALADCEYLAAGVESAEPESTCLTLEDWCERFHGWISEPVLRQVYRARPFFDLRPVEGDRMLWQRLAAAVGRQAASDPDFVPLLAHDCLANLPPLTFFEDVVVKDTGEQTAIFELERCALGPLVDVGRVFGIATGHPLGLSTFERFAQAKSALPEYDRVFRDATETLRIVLYQQARIGIRLRGDGAELPPTLLSRLDRQLLKSGFRSIAQLLEFTADRNWLGAAQAAASGQ